MWKSYTQIGPWRKWWESGLGILNSFKKSTECGSSFTSVLYHSISGRVAALWLFYTGTENNSLWELIHTKSEIEGRLQRPSSSVEVWVYYCLPKQRACGKETERGSLKINPFLVPFELMTCITPPLCKLATAAQWGIIHWLNIQPKLSACRKFMTSVLLL